MEAPPRVAFVAHSRGGLVARATAAELLSSPSAARWRDALSAIVTFGTPHDGAALAEHDARGTGDLSAARTVNGARRIDR